MKFMSIQATADGLAQRPRVVRRLGGLVARDLAMLVVLVTAEILQLLDERGARDGGVVRSWMLTSVPTPICLCKPFSCKACPRK